MERRAAESNAELNKYYWPNLRPWLWHRQISLALRLPNWSNVSINKHIVVKQRKNFLLTAIQSYEKTQLSHNWPAKDKQHAQTHLWRLYVRIVIGSEVCPTVVQIKDETCNPSIYTKAYSDVTV